MTAEWETKEEVRWWCLRPLIDAPAILSLCSLVTDPFFQCCPAERCQCSKVWPPDQVLVKEVLNGTSEKAFKEERVTYSPLAPPSPASGNSISHYRPWSDLRDGSPEWQRGTTGFWVWEQPCTAHLCAFFLMREIKFTFVSAAVIIIIIF